MGNKASTDLKPLPGAPAPLASGADAGSGHAKGETQAINGARPMRGNLYRPASTVQPAQHVQPVSVYIQRDASGSLGFAFSSARRTIHYVDSVDEGGPAEKAGLKVGHHIVAVNGQLVTNITHKELVMTLQNAPVTRPLQLKVLPSNERIQRYLRHSASRSPSAHLHLASPTHQPGSPRMAWSAPVPAFTRTASALVYNPTTKQYLCAAKQDTGYDLITASVGDGELFEETIHTLLAKDFNVPAQIVGVLRLECTPQSLNVVFLVHTTATAITLATSSAYAHTAWKSRTQLSSLNRELGRPPWSPGSTGLQTPALLDWAAYVESGETVAPLHVLALPTDAVWHRNLGGTSAAEQREKQRQSRFAIVPEPTQEQQRQQQQQQQQAPVSANAGVTAKPTATRPAAATDRTQPASTSSSSSTSATTAVAAAAAAAAREKKKKNTAAASAAPSAKSERVNEAAMMATGDGGRRESVLVDIPPPPPPPAFDGGDAIKESENEQGGTHQAEEEGQQEGQGQEEEADPDLYDNQCKEMEESVSNVRVRAFYVQRPSHSTAAFGMAVTAGESKGLQLTEEVVVQALDPSGLVAQHGGVREGDRLLKINGQWVANVGHVEYLLDVLADEPALDLTITRGEPLPHAPPAPLSSMTDQELQDAAFEHYGLRILVHPTEGWSRAAVIGTLAERFVSSSSSSSSSSSGSAPSSTSAPASTAAASVAPSDQTGAAEGASVGTDDVVLETSDSSTSQLRSALRTSTSTDESDKKGKKRKKSKKKDKRSVRFSDGDPQVEHTYSKFDYHRPLDPGRGFSDLRSLFNFNTDRMEQEQLREAENFVDSRRVYGNYIVRTKITKPFGFKLRPIPKDLSQPYLFLEGVEIVDINPQGPVGQHGGIREGDRLVKINGQWVLNHQHAEYLVFEVLRRAKALDLTVTRGEPLAPSFDLNSKTDEELLDLAFEHGGYRVAIGEGQCTREEVMLMIRKRLASSAQENPAMTGLYRTASNASAARGDEEC